MHDIDSKPNIIERDTSAKLEQNDHGESKDSLAGLHDGYSSDSSLSSVDEAILAAGPPSPIRTLKTRTIKQKQIKSHYFGKAPKLVKRIAGQSNHPFPPTSAERFGLIQERIAHNLYFLVVQSILWNQTFGRQARPVFEQLVSLYPSPDALAEADLTALTKLLQPLGLQNIRAKRLIKLGQMWIENPPKAGTAYRRKAYPHAAALALATPVTTEKLTGKQAEAEDNVWEIAHLPGCGPYALDSFRIFHRDEMRGLAKDWLGTGASDDFEPEWKRVLPLDKELKAYLKWMWLKEGWEWDWDTGKRTQVE